MQLPRGGVGVAGLGGYLYAVGGNDGRASLQSVERYNPHTDKWIEVSSMNRKRAGIVCDYVKYLSLYAGLKQKKLFLSNKLMKIELPPWNILKAFMITVVIRSLSAHLIKPNF